MVAFGAFFYDLFGERIARHEADVGDLAFTVGVSSDGSVFAHRDGDSALLLSLWWASGTSQPRGNGVGGCPDDDLDA